MFVSTEKRMEAQLVWLGGLTDVGIHSYKNSDFVESDVYERSIIARVCKVCEVFEVKCGACQGDGPRWCM